jgi:formyl-CoA transferase
MIHDIRVVDFTQALSGPYCTQILADLGADVIKVENPARGDDARHWGPPFLGADAAYFHSVNRSKRSVSLDLKQPSGKNAALALIESADVAVENWRPGVADKLGLGADHARASNPGLVYCSISGFGQDDKVRSSYDQIVQGTSGAMSMTGPDGQPTKWGLPIADLAAGMFAAITITAALYERQQSGVGRTIDISMEDCLIAMLTHQATRFLSTGLMPANDVNGHSTISPYALFATSDGHVNICVGNDAQFVRMCQGIGWDDLATDPRFRTNSDRLANKRQLFDQLKARLAVLPTATIVDSLETSGVPVGPVRRMDELFADPRVLARGMVVQLARSDFTGPIRTPNGPWKIDGRVPVATRSTPLLGEHTEEVLREIGLARAVGAPPTLYGGLA